MASAAAVNQLLMSPDVEQAQAVPAVEHLQEKTKLPDAACGGRRTAALQSGRGNPLAGVWPMNITGQSYKRKGNTFWLF